MGVAERDCDTAKDKPVAAKSRQGQTSAVAQTHAQAKQHNTTSETADHTTSGHDEAAACHDPCSSSFSNVVLVSLSSSTTTTSSSSPPSTTHLYIHAMPVRSPSNHRRKQELSRSSHPRSTMRSSTPPLPPMNIAAHTVARLRHEQRYLTASRTADHTPTRDSPRSRTRTRSPRSGRTGSAG